MGRVDEAASRRSFQCDFEHVQLGGVDHERDIHAHLQFLDDLAHQLHFVRALGDGAGDIECMRAEVHLLTGNFQNAVIILFEQEPLELARALGVQPLAEQGGRRVLPHGDRRHG